MVDQMQSTIGPYYHNMYGSQTYFLIHYLVEVLVFK